MSAFKQLNSQDIIVSPLEVNKNFIFSGSELIKDDVGINRFLGKSGNYLVSQSLTGNITGQQIPEVLVYNSIKQLYYANYISGSAGFVGASTSGSIVIGADESGNVMVGNKQSTNYYDYSQTTLWPNRFIVTASAETSSVEVGVVSIPSKLYGDYIQPESFILDVGNSGSIIDDGEGRLKFAPAGSSTYEYMNGNIIYDHGIITIFGDTIDGDTINTLGFTRSSNVTMSFSSSIKIYETQYQITVFEDEYNYSLNPSIITGSQIPTQFSGSDIDYVNTASIGKPLDFATSSYFSPYITSVGLYDNDFNLLAVGKLAKPLQSSLTTDTTILVNIDR